MTHFYKYLPSCFVENVLGKGELLFRNLTYFRQCEGRVRGDKYEGVHKDKPGTDVVIHNGSTGSDSVGKYSFLNSTDSDHIFGFCLSSRFDPGLMADFSADACIEFFDSDEFIRRVKMALGRMVYIHRVGLLARTVDYYKPSEPSLINITDPKSLAFVKNEYYRNQAEFRLAFGSLKAFKLIRQIVQPHYDPYDEAITKTPRSRMMRVGPLRDIARLITAA